MDIHSRCQPECYSEMFHLCSDHGSHFTDQLPVPGLRKQCSYRDRSTVLIISFSRKFSGIVIEQSTFQTELKWHGNNASVIYMIILHQAKSCRSVCQNDACKTFVYCTAMGFTCRTWNGNSCCAKIATLCFARISCCQIDQIFF